MKHTVPFIALLLALCFYPSFKSEGYPAFKNNENETMMTIMGKVMDEESNQPIRTTLTISIKGFSPVQATTDINGIFTVAIPVSEERKITVRAPGFESQEGDIDFPADDDAPGYVEIKLTPYVKLTLEGLVLSGKDMKPVDAQFNVYRFSDFIKEDSKMIRDGKYSEALTHFGWYMIDFSAPGYVDVTDTVWVLNCKRKSIHKNYYLAPIETGLTLKLNEIRFNFGKATITQDSHAELDQMVEFLTKNPSTQIEVAGHTDSEGPDDFNLFLSQARAQAVVSYISSKGIDPEHLIAKGYGETRPVDSNDTESGKSKNRRVELVVIKK